MRKSLVAGNWKLHGSKDFVRDLVTEIKSGAESISADVVLCPPFAYLQQASSLLEGSVVRLGAQNLCAELEGAFTGEVSAPMLSDCGCHYAIVGHSERRSLYGETNSLVAEKAQAALNAGLTAIVCVGETLAQRDAGETLAEVESQLSAVQQLLTEEAQASMVVAYEPVWAIGTGRTATPAQAQEVHAHLRGLLAEEIRESVRIVYGGSVKADNAAELFAQKDIDGALVGGASLKSEQFMAICRAAGESGS